MEVLQGWKWVKKPFLELAKIITIIAVLLGNVLYAYIIIVPTLSTIIIHSSARYSSIH